MKQNHEFQDSSLWTKMTKDVARAAKHISWHQVCMVLVVGALARDVLVRRGSRHKGSKSLRVCGYIGAVLYVLKILLRGVSSETTLFAWVYKTMASLKERLGLR